MLQFRIWWHFSAEFLDEDFRIMTWIYIAVRSNVEEIDLRLSLRHSVKQTIDLPSCIPLCGSLRSLSVDLNTILKIPSVASSNQLQYLKFKNVTIVEGLCKWISYSCKCIEGLSFENVSAENISIQNSSLESFSFVDSYDPCHASLSGEKLESITLEWRFFKPSSSGRSLNIFSPNLKYLTWINNMVDPQNLGSLMYLERAHVFLTHKEELYDFDNAFLVLCSICRVKDLILSEDTTKECRFKRKYWKSQNLEFIDQLKEVSIELSDGYISNAWELAMYILENAQNLKKMVICYLPHQSYVIERVYKSNKVSAATVIFRQRDVDEDQTMSNIYYRYISWLGNF